MGFAHGLASERDYFIDRTNVAQRVIRVSGREPERLKTDCALAPSSANYH